MNNLEKFAEETVLGAPPSPGPGLMGAAIKVQGGGGEDIPAPAVSNGGLPPTLDRTVVERLPIDRGTHCAIDHHVTSTPVMNTAERTVPWKADVHLH